MDLMAFKDKFKKNFHLASIAQSLARWHYYGLSTDFRHVRVRTTAEFFLIRSTFLHFYTYTKSWRGYIFTAVCLCVCLSVCLSVCPALLVNKFQPNGWTGLDTVFAKWLLTALVWTLLKLVTLGQRLRSQWRNMHFSSWFSVNFITLYLSSLIFGQIEIRYVAKRYLCSICV